jgi:hypothetical protein
MGIFIAVCTLVVIVVLVREIIITMKRPQRIGDLRHHIIMIADPAGREFAQGIVHYNSCRHIMEHYRIDLRELGELVTCDGCIIADLADVYVEVGKSDLRAKIRKDLAMNCRSVAEIQQIS